MDDQLLIEPLTAKAFAPFGEIIDSAGDPSVLINNGNCARFHDRAKLDFDPRGQAGISIFVGQPNSLPHRICELERHPLGSQAFVPMSGKPYLVVVADEDAQGNPVSPRAFVAQGHQGVNIGRGVWHGALTPLEGVGHFGVVDWIGDVKNFDGYTLQNPIVVSEQVCAETV